MSQHTLVVVTGSFDDYIEEQRKATLARHAAERIAQLRELATRRRSFPRERRMPSSEEVCQRIADIVSREDVRRAAEHARNFAKSVRLVSGGAPGLGRR